MNTLEEILAPGMLAGGACGSKKIGGVKTYLTG